MLAIKKPAIIETQKMSAAKGQLGGADAASPIIASDKFAVGTAADSH